MDSSRSLKEKLISQVEAEINRENDVIQLLRQEIKDREQRIEEILNQDTEARQLLQLLKKGQYQDNGTGVVPKPKKSVRERRQEYLDACRMLMDDQAKITLDALHDLMGGERGAVSQFLIKNDEFQRIAPSTYVMKEGDG
jgi:septal ring factor EnvC (AmiA/AmiB activator)